MTGCTFLTDLWSQSWCPCICQIWRSCRSCWFVRSQMTRGCRLTEKKVVGLFLRLKKKVEATWRSTSFTLSISPCWATLVIWGEKFKENVLIVNHISKWEWVLLNARHHLSIWILSNGDAYTWLTVCCCVLGWQLFFFPPDCKLSIAAHCWRLSNNASYHWILFRARSFLQLFGINVETEAAINSMYFPKHGCVRVKGELMSPLKFSFDFESLLLRHVKSMLST